MTKRDLEKLKKKLPPGWAKTIADKAKVSPDYVRRVLRNDRKNDAVVEFAIEVAKSYHDELQKKREEINAL